MFTVAQIADWTHGTVIGDGGTVIADSARVVIDSRKIQPGDLFVALIGPNHDAHRFLDRAFTDGAAAALVSDPNVSGNATQGADRPLVRVPDTEAALRDLARSWRGRFTLPVAAVTGSCGKTTVKEMARAILADGHGPDLNPLATEGNLNNQIGLPLTLLALRPGHRTAVIEMGINRPGEIDLLCAVTHPTVGLITGIGRAHLAGLKDADGVAAEKGRLFKYLQQTGGRAVVNLDDARIVDRADAHGVTDPFTYSTAPGVHADLCLRLERQQDDGARVTLELNGDSHSLTLFSAAPHQLANAAAVVVLCHVMGATAEQIIAGLEGFAPPAMRGRETTLDNGAGIIDDSYNANPESMAAALTALTTATALRRMAVLGDMLELGDDAEALHRQLGHTAATLGIDRLICVGPLSLHTAEGAMEAGLEAVHHLLEPQRAVALLADLRRGDRVLVKGSRGMAMETVVGHLIDAATQHPDMPTDTPANTRPDTRPDGAEARG